MKTPLLLAALAGLVSGLLVLIVPAHFLLYLEAGLFFGVAMAAYFAFYEKCHSFARLGVFVLVCTAACPISVLSAYYAARFLTGGDLGESGSSLPYPALFIAGYIGAALVLITGMFLFGSQEGDFTFLVRALAWSAVGGVLGLTARLGTTRPLVFVAWPTGVGLVLSAMLQMERRSSSVDGTTEVDTAGSPIPEKNWILRIVVGTIAVCTIGFLGRIVYYEIKMDRRMKASIRAEQEVRNNTPSMQSLPQIVPVQLEDALVLTPVGGFVPRTKLLEHGNLRLFQNLPFIEYYLSYVRPSELQGEFPDPVHVVQVRIRQAPNRQWASYLSRLPDSGNYLEAPNTVKPVVKFGERIVHDSSQVPDYGGGIDCFHWPSQNFAASVCFEGMPIDEQFLKVYLRKYPSAW